MTKDKKYLFIGDIHGCLDELKELLANTGWYKDTPEFKVILLGDLVDRGPDSKGVIRFTMENNLSMIRGNHDDRYIGLKNKIQWHQINQRSKKPMWMRNYPDRINFLNSLSDDEFLFLEQAPTLMTFPDLNLVAVHAGFLPGKPLALQEENTKMHIRFLNEDLSPAHLDKDNDYCQPQNSFFWAERFEEPYNVIYGHHVWDLENIVTHETKLGYKCYGIDTGCCFGGRLSGLMFFSDGSTQLYQVQARKEYA
jgi:bis(5'-nucleosyl)-tetraphosphatase (symmetrical)